MVLSLHKNINFKPRLWFKKYCTQPKSFSPQNPGCHAYQHLNLNVHEKIKQCLPVTYIVHVHVKIRVSHLWHPGAFRQNLIVTIPFGITESWTQN